MTPSEIEAQARAKYNAAGDNFFSSLEICGYIYQAELEISNECDIIEAYTTMPVISGTRKYAFPSQVRKIKRVEAVDASGTVQKLEPITFREDDALTLVNVASTTLGKPQFYEIFNFNIYLRPIPDGAYTLNIYSYNEPIVVTTTSTLELPTPFHMDVTDFVVMHMYLKNQNIEMAKAYADVWTSAKSRMKRWAQKKKRGDAFTIVMNEDNLAVTLTGPV